MSTEKGYTALAEAFGKRPGITEEETRERLNNYIENILTPPLEEDEILTMIEATPAVPGQRHILPRYEGAQRDDRRTLSLKMRQCLIEDACWASRLNRDYYSNNVQIGRGGQSLFYYEAPGHPDPRNREVLWLLDQNPENRPGYIAEMKRHLMEEGKTEQEAQQQVEEYFTDDAIRTRLSQLVMNRVRESAALLPHLEDMTSLDLQPEELAENYIKIRRAHDVLMDLDIFILQARENQGRLQMSDEDIAFMRQQQNNQFIFMETVLPLQALANPLYEFVDLDGVIDSDTEKLLSKQHGILRGQRGEDYRRHCLAADPDYETYAGVAEDNFEAYVGDALMLRNQIRVRTDMREQSRMENVYGFIPGLTTQICESNWDYEMTRETHTPLSSDKPTAYEIGNRVVILTATGTNSHPVISAENPEAMFNFVLKEKNAKILNLLDSTDVWYKRSSPEYREMKSALERACAVRPLKEGADRQAEELDAARAPFEALLAATETYLQKKPEKSDNPYENNRIQAAKKIKAHAEVKLRELELIEKARLTLERYRGMSDEEIRNATNIENEEHGRIIQADEHKKDPVKWLNNLCDKYREMGMPEYFCNSFSDEIQKLNARARDENGIFTGRKDTLALTAKMLIGYSVAGELILRERAQRDNDQLPKIGPIETAFTTTIERCNYWCDKLGKIVFENAVKEAPEYLSLDELTHVIDFFDPRAIADTDTVTESFSVVCSAQFVNEVQQQCCKPVLDDRVIREFISDFIYDPLIEIQGTKLDMVTDVSFDSAYNMMNSYVLVNMAGGEGQTAERLRMLMKNQDNISELRNFVSASPSFKELVGQFDFQTKNTNIFTLSELVHLGNPQVTALDIMNEAQFSSIVNDMWEKQHFAAESNSASFINAVRGQYSDPVFSQPPLHDFVNDNIVTPANSYQAKMKDMDVSTDFAAGYRLLSSCVLASAIQIESKGKGKLSRFMSNKDNIDSMLQLIQASKSFKEMIDDFHNMGDHPDINEIPKLLQSKQPQNAARKFLKNELSQMLSSIPQQHKPAGRQVNHNLVVPGRS